MKVQMTTVGLMHNHEVPWPADWPPPAVGDYVVVDSDAESAPLHVRVVEWYPVATPEPFVYIVVGTSPQQGAG